MKFCFSCNIADTLNGRAIGGGELQISLLAKALATKGHEVVIIDPHASEDFVTPEGIKVLHVPGWDKGIRGLRLLTHRIPAMYRLFREQKADYYYVRMRSYFHLIPYRAARKTGGKFILSLASDIDVMPLRGRIKYEYKTNFNLLEYLTLYLPNDLTFNFLARRADIVTLQHRGQRLRNRSAKAKTVIYSNILDFNTIPAVETPSRDYYVHVGTLSALKGSENLLNLAKSVNGNSRIAIVGTARGSKSRSQEIYEELQTLKHIELKGRRDHVDTLRLIGNAKALINTSFYEGFPNVFLEAWAQGVPVISLNVNPGNVINEYGLGVCCDGDLGKMKQCIEQDATGRLDKQQLVTYTKNIHDFNTAADRFLALLGGEHK